GSARRAHLRLPKQTGHLAAPAAIPHCPRYAAVERCSPGSSVEPSVMCLNQLLQVGTEWRQVVLPTQHSATHRELGIALLHMLFEVHAHAGHQFQILDNCAANPLHNPAALLAKLVENAEQLGFKLKIVHFK